MTEAESEGLGSRAARYSASGILSLLFALALAGFIQRFYLHNEMIVLDTPFEQPLVVLEDRGPQFGSPVDTEVLQALLEDGAIAAAESERPNRPPLVSLPGYPTSAQALSSEGGHASDRDGICFTDAYQVGVEGPIAQLVSGEVDEMIGETQRIVAADPADSCSQYLLAVGLFIQGRSSEAEQHLDSILQRNSDSADGLVMLGLVLGDLHRTDEAILRIDQAIRLGLGWEGYLARALVLVRAGHAGLARRDLWRAAEVNPIHGESYYMLAVLEAREGDAEASVQLLRFASRDPWFFSVFMSQDEFAQPGPFEMVRDEPVFAAYVDRLPRESLTRFALHMSHLGMADRWLYDAEATEGFAPSGDPDTVLGGELKEPGPGE